MLGARLSLLLVALTPWVWAADPAVADSAAGATVRVPQLSVFRSLRELCIQTGSTATLDFGTWEASDGTLDFSVGAARLAVRRAAAFSYEGPRAGAFARWCALNAGFTATVAGNDVRVSFQSDHPLAERHRVFVTSPLFAKLSITLDDDSRIAWDSLGAELRKAGEKVSKDNPYRFIRLTSPRDPKDAWLGSTCVPGIASPVALAWEDSFQQVLGKLIVPGTPSIGYALSTPSTFHGGVIGYNAERTKIPDDDVISGVTAPTEEFRKRYHYVSEVACRIDCAMELVRRLEMASMPMGKISEAKTVELLLKAVDADTTSELVLQLLLETMNAHLAEHIWEVVARQDILLRKRFVFSLLPTPTAVKDEAWEKHFSALWAKVAKDPSEDIRAYAADKATP